jgi:hypothetical protein
VFQDSDQRRLIDAVSDIFRLIPMHYYKEYVKKEVEDEKPFCGRCSFTGIKHISVIDVIRYSARSHSQLG